MTDTKKPDALLWATHLEGIFVSEEITATQARKIAAELRRLHAENEALRAAALEEAAEWFEGLYTDQQRPQNIADAIRQLKDKT